MTPREFVDEFRSKYKDCAEIDLYPDMRENLVEISNISVSEEDRGKGCASRAFKLLTKMADEHQVTLWLEVGGEDGGIDGDVYALVNFYNRYGFEPHEDHGYVRKPEPINESKIRFPKTQKVFEEILSVLEEEKVGKKRYVVRPSTILALAEEKRLKRAENVKILTLEQSEEGTIKRYDFEAESSEKSEADSHIGYVEIVKSSGNVNSLFCSCSDQQAKYHYHNEKTHKIADYEKGEEIGAMNEYFDPHSREFPIEMNPNGSMGENGMCCKHILGVLQQISNNPK